MPRTLHLGRLAVYVVSGTRSTPKGYAWALPLSERNNRLSRGSKSETGE